MRKGERDSTAVDSPVGGQSFPEEGRGGKGAGYVILGEGGRVLWRGGGGGSCVSLIFLSKGTVPGRGGEDEHQSIL